MRQHNQVNFTRRAMQKTLEIVQDRVRVAFGARINDDNTLIIDELSICHGKTVGNRMYLGELLIKGRRSFFTFQSSVQSFPPAVARHSPRHIVSPCVKKK